MWGHLSLHQSLCKIRSFLHIRSNSFNTNIYWLPSFFSLFSSLFPDVVNCMQTDNLELKKLVYLYLMNYAKSQPDMAIMAVNSFVKVTSPQRLRSSLFYLSLCRSVSWYSANKQPLFQKRASREVEAVTGTIHILSTYMPTFVIQLNGEPC